MNRVELFAGYFGADRSDVCHIYDDGFLLVLSASQRRRDSILKSLQENYDDVEWAISDDGFSTVFVIPFVVDENDAEAAEVAATTVLTPVELLRKHPMLAVTGSYHDHRFEDLSTLESIENFLLR